MSAPQRPTAIGPQIPSHLPNDEYGPAPHEDPYMPARPPRRPLGPSLPARDEADSSSDSDEVGPMPAPAGSQASSADDAVREFVEHEERRRKAGEEARQPKKLQREEWMLVPPSSSGVLGSLDPTKLKARQFSRSSNPAVGTRDNSLWTETPVERQARLKDEVDGKRKRATDVAADSQDQSHDDRKRLKYEAHVKAQVDEFNRQTRANSLVDIHQSSSGKERDKDDGHIWDHARDMSVGGRLMDDGQRSKMITEARALGDRFGKGKTGGFL